MCTPSAAAWRQVVVGRWGPVAVAGVPPLLLALGGLAHPGSLTASTAGHWRDLHVWLLPVFPLLGVTPWLLLRRRHPTLRWTAAVLGYVFAAWYTALDVLAGIGAGAVEADEADERAVATLFHNADGLALVGTRAYLAAAVLAAAAVVLQPRPPAAPGRTGAVRGAALLAAVTVVAAAVSFQHSHIFRPRGVVTMLALALGWSVLAWAAAAGRSGPEPAAADNAEQTRNKPPESNHATPA